METSKIQVGNVTQGVINILKDLFVYFWLHWLFVVTRGRSLVAASGGYSLLQCTGFSLWWPPLLQGMDLSMWALVAAVHRLSYSASCGIFPDQGSNHCSLHWQADS